jgi:hypothetical protein
MPKEIVDFALLQVGARIDAGRRRDGLVLGHAHVQAHRAAALLGAVKVIDHIEAFADAARALPL